MFIKTGSGPLIICKFLDQGLLHPSTPGVTPLALGLSKETSKHIH